MRITSFSLWRSLQQFAHAQRILIVNSGNPSSRENLEGFDCSSVSTRCYFLYAQLAELRAQI